MPKVTEADVLKIAKLAHLTLTGEERATFAKELDAILAYAERLLELDTENVEPTSHALLRSGVFRDDEERPASRLERKEALGLAPDDGDGLFKVPRVLP